MLTTSLLLAIFLGSLLSGWHCALMCGGIAAGIEGGAEKPLLKSSIQRLWQQQLIMHFGRMTTYVLLGALAGGIGAALWQQNFIPLQRPLFALASSILIFLGLRLLYREKAKVGLAGLWFGNHLARYWAHYLGRQASTPARWFSGMLWGLVPCGLVYSILPLAFLSGSPLTGAAFMLAFGLGTLPNLLLITRFSAALVQFSHYPWVRIFAASLLIVSGIFGFYRAWTLPEALLKGGFCFT
ncbi:sulfite exporter TauE/SafE family protein [Polynucleobacter sp. IMCC30063]|uniref:sulfite exporter TauE/SafE family protein n=1 Tax=Polynucleobacter sp. IMCC30063 TaxID=2907298 RepID=UPI001F176BA6|nr:sulfite exporter TauE/SafE family protein [Polynucleobacter sp. IMCC30063]